MLRHIHTSNSNFVQKSTMVKFDDGSQAAPAVIMAPWRKPKAMEAWGHMSFWQRICKAVLGREGSKELF